MDSKSWLPDFMAASTTGPWQKYITAMKRYATTRAAPSSLRDRVEGWEQSWIQRAAE